MADGEDGAPETGPSASVRTFSINEVAALVGAEAKAVRRRTERGTLRVSGVEVRDGKPLKVIPEPEVRRVWPDVVIPEPGEAVGATAERGRGTTSGGAPAARTRPQAAPEDGLRALGAQIERLAGEVATHRLLEAQAGERARNESEARRAAEAALVESRAREAAARAREAAALEAKLAAEARARELAAELAERAPAAAQASPLERMVGEVTPGTVTPQPEGLWARIKRSMNPPPPG